MEITTTTMGMVGTIGVPIRDFRHVALRSMMNREKVRYAASSFVNIALTWWNTQIQARGRETAIGMTWSDFKALLWRNFVQVMRIGKGAPESARIKRYVEGLAPEIRGMLKATQPTTIQNAILRAGILMTRRELLGLSKCIEMRARKWMRMDGGRALNVNVNAVEALQDLNVMTGTFSLNDHFATTLFDSGPDFSFISIEFAPLLNVKPSIVNPGYVIEVADGKKVEVDRIIRDCKLELGNFVQFLGLVVNQSGIQREPGKRDGSKELESSETSSSFDPFLGLAGLGKANGWAYALE
ncbi:reverse transcriptase domain-containing protein [Tanacetum coccineum]|uniref:Reverse transcriptase domain-containing protein n=1 Tax=Tanacetum coccineum TaxID=301880 RepID=A0ABQ5B9H1_9ASTR